MVFASEISDGERLTSIIRHGDDGLARMCWLMMRNDNDEEKEELRERGCWSVRCGLGFGASRVEKNASVWSAVGLDQAGLVSVT